MSGGTGHTENLPTDAQTSYGPFFGVDICQNDPTACEIVLAAGGTASNLYASSNEAPGTDKSWTFTLVKNGADQAALTCTITGSATSCNDTTGTVVFAAGDRISIKMTAAGNPSGSVEGSWSIQYS